MILEVDLSEAQWAAFVSSLNVGSGVPCTLDRVGTELIPGIARRVETDVFHDETAGIVKEAIQRIEKAVDEVTRSALAISRKRSILTMLRAATQHLRANLPFMVQSFDQHVERKLEKAKIEVNAYATSQIIRAGLEHLAPSAPIEIEGPSED